jgi:cbb3-type cytochrome oxidase maturation protein
MNVIYGLLAISIAIAIVFFIVFILSVKNNQYEDTYTPSVRMLFDDELVKDQPKSSENQKSNHKHKQS